MEIIIEYKTSVNVMAGWRSIYVKALAKKRLSACLCVQPAGE
jgi:hypothetical protein